MFNVGPFELLIIAIAVLLIFPPKQLPEIARTVGKFLREFRRQTEEVRSTIEREFYQMDLDLSLDSEPSKAKPAEASPALPSNTAARSEADGAQPADHVLHEGETPAEPADHVLHEGETPAQPADYVFHEGELPPAESLSTAPSDATNNGLATIEQEALEPPEKDVHPRETPTADSSADSRTSPVAKAHQ